MPCGRPVTQQRYWKARDMASVAYDAAKTAGRLARAKHAHDDIMRGIARAQADALKIEARAKVRLADEYDLAQSQGDMPKAGRPSTKNLPEENNFSSSDVGTSHKEIHEARQLRDAEERNPGLIETSIEEVLQAGREPTKAVVRQAVDQTLGKGVHGVRGAQGASDDEWYTPVEIIESARLVMGGIDLDPASCEAAQKNVKAARFYTVEDDGLAQQWPGRVWINPPFSQGLISRFVGHLFYELHDGRTTEAVLLANAYTDAAWFHGAAMHAQLLCFTRGRVQFKSPTKASTAPTIGQVLFYFGARPEAFREEFAKYGHVR